MIHLELMGMVGNNLFQYVFARILAEEMGYSLRLKHSTYQSETNIPFFEELMANFKDAPLEIEGRSFEEPQDNSAVVGRGNFDGYRIHPKQITKDTQNRKICVRGHFERYDCIKDYKEQIRRWFQIDSTNLGHDVQGEDIVLHIRRGDFISYGRALSLSFYVKLLKKLNYKKVFVCGVGLDDEAVKRALKPFKPTYVYNKPLEDFRFIKGFRKIIISQSTFSWWAAFLSEAKEIYVPVPIPDSTEFLRAHPHVDLRVDDESRFRYVKNVPPMESLYSITDVIKSAPYLLFSEKVKYFSAAVSRSAVSRFKKAFVREK